MKTILLITLLFLGISSYAQTNEIRIYKNNTGLSQIQPSQIIIQQPNGNYNIYETNRSGLPSINPSKILVPNNNGYDVYNTKNGIPNINPSETIIIE